MNAVPTAPADNIVPLTRKQKQHLLNQMYFKAHWVELIRLFRHQTLPLVEAKAAMEPLVARFGKEPLAVASETMIEIFVKDESSFARLKPDIRRMAFSLIGPEPTPEPEAPKPIPPPKTSARTPRSEEKPTLAATKSRSRRDIPKAPSAAGILDQYRAAKGRHPHMLLLFRMGDFYELFDKDAEVAAKLLGLTLTTRDRTIAMTGFPHHQLEIYLRKLLQAGERVAVCEQVEESRPPTGGFRPVGRVVTPDTLIEPQAAREETTAARPVRQPRHLALQECEAWMKRTGQTFVAGADVGRATPAARAYAGVLDFIVMRDEEKFIVTIRPHLQAKHVLALGEVRTLLGAEHGMLRIWPHEKSGGEWEWCEYPVEPAGSSTVPEAAPKANPKRLRSKPH